MFRLYQDVYFLLLIHVSCMLFSCQYFFSFVINICVCYLNVHVMSMILLLVSYPFFYYFVCAIIMLVFIIYKCPCFYLCMLLSCKFMCCVFLFIYINCYLLIYFVYLNLQKIAKKESPKQVLIVVVNCIFGTSQLIFVIVC